jgi:Chalcone isomerase-like
MNRFSASLLFFLSLTLSMGAQAEQPPPASLSIEGRGPLTHAARATRRDLLGAMELYTIALYTDGGPVTRELLASPDTAKALRIQVSYDEDLRRRTAIDWRRELLPRLESPGLAHLQGSFAPIQYGDTIVVEYVPTRGTTVRVNKGVVVSGANHDLMLAFLDHWIGQRPLSEEIKETLLRR